MLPFKNVFKKSKGEDVSGHLTASGDAAQEVQLHPDAHEDGGLSCNNDELLRVQREAIMEWIKSMGKRLLTGSINLISTPFPVTMFEPRSYLEKLADVWVYPRYLAQASATQDPLERMKLVVTWFLAGLHHGFEKWKKPFNPILGETWQAVLSDGSSMFMEQISHHPPVSAFNIEGPGRSYRFMGLSQPIVSVVVKHYGFKTVAKGFRYIEFPDGCRIDMLYPSYYIKGVVYSSRPRAEVDGQAVFIDAKNCLKAIIRFGPVKHAKAAHLKRSDAVVGEIYDIRGTAEAQRYGPSAISHTSADTNVTGSEDERPDAADDEFESASETEWDSREPHDLANLADQFRDVLGNATPAQIADPHHALPNERSSTGVRDDACAPPAQPISRVSPSLDSAKHSSLLSGLTKMMGLSSSMGTSASPNGTLEQQGVQLASLDGSWLSHVNIDGCRYWALVSERPDMWHPVDDPLPSDSRFRMDLAKLAEGDLKASQIWKEKLENMQRADKKLRGH